MRHLRITGLCMAAAFAIAAFTANSAFAGNPEFGQCYAKEGGKYADSNCQTKAKSGTGKFEWRKEAEVPNKGFTGEGGAGVLAGKYEVCEGGPNTERRRSGGCPEGEFSTLAVQVECTSEKAHGEITGKNTVGSVAVKFFGCKALGSIPCSNSAEPETVEVNTLKGNLGWINKSKKEVGVLLTPVLKHGAFASFNCGGANFLSTVVGVGSKTEGFAYGPPKGGGDGIISPITPVDQMSPTYTQEYTQSEEDENIPNKFEGKPLQVLESYLFNATEPQYTSEWSKSAEVVTNVNTGEEEGEIKA
jgi:hypothetical protein